MTGQILVVSNTLSASFVFRKTLLESLMHKGLLGAVWAWKNDIESENTELHCFGSFYDSDSVLTCIKLALRPNIALIHSFTHLGNLVSVILGLVGGKLVVLTVTGMGSAFGRKDSLGLLLRFMIRSQYFLSQFFAGAIIVQNQDDFGEIKRLLLPSSRCKVFLTAGSGVPLDYFNGVKPVQKICSSEIRVGFFSRAICQKGIWDFYKLAREYKDSVELTFIHVGLPGKGELSRQNLIATAMQWNVQYFGHVLDLRPWLLSVDLIILPSVYREGVSRLLIESMLAGKIVVARDTTGVRDHIVSGVNGVLYCRASDLGLAFTDACRLRNSEMRINARKYARQHFDVKDVNATYFSAYTHVGVKT